MNKAYAAALLIAAATSSAALAAPKGDSSGSGYDEPGKYFNCVIPFPGPKGFRTGACWLDGATPA
ncbi:MAG TPA: hypothetical protein VFU20_00600 [Sphingomicrobium sp.]|nr:hypothetical protein [Sphingomicrobium sp.]